MSSSSRSQQRFFGWVNACQKGTAKHCPPNIAKVASSISAKDAEDFAKTKHEGLPERKQKEPMKKKSLKSYTEFSEERIEEQLNSQQRQLAGMSMGDPQQAHQAAKSAGINVQRYYRFMSKWLADIEERMGLKNQQSGENANQWHQQAVGVLQSALNMAAGGKVQWTTAQQLRNFKKKAQGMPTQQPQQQPPVGGPTPLDSIQ